jgi:hypothetical protein
MGFLRFDTSIGRGDTVTVIGAGRLIKGEFRRTLPAFADIHVDMTSDSH